jgi:hypothetical protein
MVNEDNGVVDVELRGVAADRGASVQFNSGLKMTVTPAGHTVLDEMVPPTKSTFGTR